MFSHWGKGVYWDVVEHLREQEKYTYSSDEFDLKMLCDLIGCKDEEKFLKWFQFCLEVGLFELKGNDFFCPPLTESMKKWDASKSNGKKGGRPPKKEPKQNPKETQEKPKQNPSINLTETITEQYSTEQKKTEENKRVKDILERENDFRLTASQHQFEFDLSLIENFCDYWTEPNKSKTKMKFELQKTFDIKRRLKTWERNNFGNNRTEKPSQGGIADFDYA